MSESIENSVNGKPLRPRLKSNSGSIKPARDVLSANATTPTTGKIRVKIKAPIPVQVGNEVNMEWKPPNRSGLPNQLKELLVPVGSVVLLIAILVTGYLRLVKGVDIFKPVRNRIATASYVLFGPGDHAVISRDDLTYLVSNSENNVKLPYQTIIIQSNDSASIESNASTEATAKRTATTPSIQWEWRGTNADNNVSSSEPARADTPETKSTMPVTKPEAANSDQGEASVAVASEKPEESGSAIIGATGTVDKVTTSASNNAPSPLVEQKQATNTPAVTVASGAVMGTGKEDDKVAVLQKKAESDDAEAQCKLGDYYNSINDKESALEWYRRAAERGWPKGLCRYGKIMMKGEGTQTNKIEAVEMFKKAVAMNDPEGQCLLANCFLKGQGVPKNEAEAVQMFQYAAAQSNAEAYCRLGECALKGIGMAKNVNQAMLFLKKSAEMNYSPGYYQMGEAYAKGLSGAPNLTTALSMYKKAAVMNNIKAKCQLVSYYAARAKNAPSNREEMVRQLRSTVTNSVDGIYDEEEKTMLVQIYMLYGDYLINGTYMKENLSEGVRFYEKAAKAGNFEGSFKYGMCLLNGKGLQQNESEGFNLLMTAAKGEYAKAMWMVGESYLKGKGVERDSKQANDWFLKAANNDVPEAQYRMGEFCLDGTKNESNNKKAFEWFQKAANKGYEPAIEKVVECYEQSIGVKKDIKILAMWRSKLGKKQKKTE